MVAKATQRKLTGAMVWLNITLAVILTLVLMLGSLYIDFKTADTANKKIEKRIEKIKQDYDLYCRKED